MKFPKKNKYNVAAKILRTHNGVVFDSKKEMIFQKQLELLVKAKEVVSFERQIPYQIIVNGQKICKYILDFIVVYADGKTEYIDVKSPATAKLPVYRLKKKLMKAVHGIEITEK